MQCDRLMLMVGLSFLTLSRWLTTDSRRFMIIPMLCVTIFVILVVWFLLPRVARLMIHTPTAISIFVCLSMVQLMAVFISMRCTLCGHFLFTENIINGVERPVKAAELFAFTLRVRAGNTDVLTDAEENVRQKLRAEGVM